MELNALLIEDNLDLANTLIDFLALESITCDHAFNGRIGEDLALNNQYDVLLLDINLPGKNGLNVCQQLRQCGNDTPILMLTARDSLTDKLKGFEAGSDDYLVKPFELLELVARIRVLAKRRSGQIQHLQIADLQMDLQQRIASRNGQPLKLSPIGWKILELLMRSSPDAVSKHQLERSIWGEDTPASNSLKVHLHHLRKEVDGNHNEQLIHTISGYGLALHSLQQEAL